MRKAILAALAVAAALLSGGMTEKGAEAMTLAPPSALGVTAAGTHIVQNAAVACGFYGCGRIYRSPYGYYRPYGYYYVPYYGYYRPWGWSDVGRWYW